MTASVKWQYQIKFFDLVEQYKQKKINMNTFCSTLSKRLFEHELYKDDEKIREFSSRFATIASATGLKGETIDLVFDDFYLYADTNHRLLLGE